MTLYNRDDFDTSRSAGIWTRLTVSARRWWENRQMRRARGNARIEMSEMPDWQLRDIGVRRGDIDRLMPRHGSAMDGIKSDLRH